MGKKLVFFDLTIFLALTASFFASTNHCSVKKGSIIEFDLSPYGTLFLMFSSLTRKSFLVSSFNNFFLASKRSSPINSSGALLLILPSSVKTLIIFNLFGKNTLIYIKDILQHETR